MSQQKVDIARDGLERFLATGEPDLELLDEHAVIRDHDIPDPRDYRGRRGFVKWLQDWGEAWEEWTIEPLEYLDAGDQVVIVCRMKARGRGSGLEIDRQDALVYGFRDGKVVSIDYFNSREQGLAAAGLAASN
ncbi:MAG TPA: nuclear transport factor 2 family protein [Thermoleophilaceae bacterium]